MTEIDRPNETQLTPSRNRFDRMEWAGAFGDLGTLIPFVVGYIVILKMVCRNGEMTRVHSLLRLIATAVCILVAVPSVLKAKHDRCEGLVQVGQGDWSIIICSHGGSVCWFWTDSKAGHRILAECPDGSVCSISVQSKGEPRAPTEHGRTKTIVEVWDIRRIEGDR